MGNDPKIIQSRKKAERQKEYDKRTGYAAQRKYIENNIKRYVINCVANTEQDIINHLEQQENKAGYIKRLIREDMKKESTGGEKQ